MRPPLIAYTSVFIILLLFQIQFTFIGFVDIPGLSAPDHVSLCVIEKYLDFKQGEVWREINAELEQESVRPVTPDQVK